MNPQIFNQLPHLIHLNLNQNPLTEENVVDLIQATATIAAETERNINIIADDIGKQYLRAGVNIKGTKR